jgi:DNA-directed RNA polymerase subunit RPC12/RpoP
VQVDEVITCIDCGGRAHLLSYPPEDGEWSPGDVVTYRCADCLDRWDLVVPDDTPE